MAAISKCYRFTQEMQRFTRTFRPEDVEINAASVLRETIGRKQVELSLFNLFVAHTSTQLIPQRHFQGPFSSRVRTLVSPDHVTTFGEQFLKRVNSLFKHRLLLSPAKSVQKDKRCRFSVYRKFIARKKQPGNLIFNFLDNSWTALYILGDYAVDYSSQDNNFWDIGLKFFCPP